MPLPPIPANPQVFLDQLYERNQAQAAQYLDGPPRYIPETEAGPPDAYVLTLTNRAGEQIRVGLAVKAEYQFLADLILGLL